jgi:type II secretory pathway component PulF
MSSFSDVIAIWNARRLFNPQRSAFYRDLGASLTAGAPLKGLITEYAKQDVPGISPMMSLWGEGMLAHPGSLARATTGLVSESDTIIISAAEMNPGTAGKLYQMYASNLAQRKSMIRAVMLPLMLPAFTFAALVGVLFFFKLVIYADMLKAVPLKYWPAYGALSYAVIDFSTGLGGALVAAGVIGLFAWVTWSLNNWTGPVRDWADRTILPYTLFAQMELISTVTAICSMIDAGIADTVALNKVTSNGSLWMSYQMEKIRAHTGRGKTVLTSLRDLPLPKMLAARIVVLAGEEKLADTLPELVIKSCQDETVSMVERMQVMSRLITISCVLVLMGFVAVLMLGNISFSEASRTMSSAKQMSH